MNSINLEKANLKKMLVSVRLHQLLIVLLMLFSVFAASLFYNFKTVSAQNQPKVQTLPLLLMCQPFRQSLMFQAAHSPTVVAQPGHLYGS